MNLLQYLEGETDKRIQDQYQNQVRYSTVARLENGIPFRGETFKRHGFEHLETLDGALRIEAFNISSASNLSFLAIFYSGYITFYNQKTNDFIRDSSNNVVQVSSLYTTEEVIKQLKFSTYQSTLYIYHKSYETMAIAYIQPTDSIQLDKFSVVSPSDSNLKLQIWALGKIVTQTVGSTILTYSTVDEYLGFRQVQDLRNNGVTAYLSESFGSFIEVVNGKANGFKMLNTYSGPLVNGSTLVYACQDMYFRISGKSFFIGEKVYLTDNIYLQVYSIESSGSIAYANIKHNTTTNFVLQNNMNTDNTIGNVIRARNYSLGNPDSTVSEGALLSYYYYNSSYTGPLPNSGSNPTIIQGNIQTIEFMDFTTFYNFTYRESINFADGVQMRQRHWGVSDLFVYASAPNQFNNYTTTGDSGFAYDPSGGLNVKSVDDQLNEYYWIQEFKDTLLFGHPEKIDTSPVSPSPTNFSISTLFKYGCGNIEPVATEDNIFFVDRDQTRVMSILDNEYGQVKATDITEVSENAFILQNGIKRMQHQRSYYPILWVIDNNGNLFGLNTLTTRWTRIVTNGIVKSIAVTSGSSKDIFYLLIERNINGQTKVFLEKWLEQRNQEIDLKEQFYLDAGKYFYNATPQTTFTVAHLPNTEVKVLADGQDLTITTDETGSFTLEQAVNYLSVGLPYTLKIKSHAIDVVFNLFSSKFKFKRIQDIIVTVINSFRGLKLYFSNRINQKYSRDFNKTQNLVDSPVSDTIRITAGYISRGHTDVTIEHSEPNQCIITSVQVNMDAN